MKTTPATAIEALPHDRYACWHLVGPNDFKPGVLTHATRLAPGDVEVRMLACGHCESDANIACLGRHPSQEGEGGRVEPILLGHEPVGEVVKLGPGVTRLRVGDIVALEPGKSCGQCSECHVGHYNVCRKVKYMATPAKGWNYGCYAKHIRWPEMLCHLVPQGLDPVLASLAESMAAGRQSIEYVSRTYNFKAHRECVVIVGAGQMSMNILLQLKRRWPELNVIVMARKEEDRTLATQFGANTTVPLSGAQWNNTERKEHLLEACLEDEPELDKIVELARSIRCAKTQNSSLFAENVEFFAEARRMAQGRIACVIECTGQSHIVEAAIKARAIRGHGTYGLVSCVYDVRFDMANVRRDGGTVWTLRRSADQFGETLAEIARNQDFYRRLIGHEVDFHNLPHLYNGHRGTKVGLGPKVVIKYAEA
jgi:threonine dehydrogenase-like Zn-dependent dehydrogenase